MTSPLAFLLAGFILVVPVVILSSNGMPGILPEPFSPDIDNRDAQTKNELSHPRNVENIAQSENEDAISFRKITLAGQNTRTKRGGTFMSWSKSMLIFLELWHILGARMWKQIQVIEHLVQAGTSGQQQDNSLLILKQKFTRHLYAFLAAQSVSPVNADNASDPRASPPLESNPMTSCLPVSGYSAHRWINIVSSCPPEWKNETIRYNCQTAVMQDGALPELPVQSSSGVVFANAFCAKCHGESNVLRWKASWTCEKTDELMRSIFGLFENETLGNLMAFAQNDESCNFTATPPLPNSITPCESPRFREYSPGFYINSGDHDIPRADYPVSFNILMNFDFSGKTHIMFVAGYEQEIDVTVRRCDPGDVFDTIENQCRQISCGLGYRREGSTCIPIDQGSEEIGSVQNEEEIFQLVHSSDIERVVLEVNIPPEDMGWFSIPGYENYFKEQIAYQLNITSSRMQNFNITVHEGHVDGEPIYIERMTPEEYRHEVPGASQGEVTFNDGSSVDTQEMTEVGCGTDCHPDPSAQDSQSGHKKEDYDKPVLHPAPPNTVETEYSKVQPEHNVTMRISFILLPPESRSSDEQWSDNVMETLDLLVNKHSLRLTINGTTLVVESVERDDSVGDYEPPCPYGIVSFVYEHILLTERHNPVTGLNETVLIVQNTGRVYPPGKFDLTLAVEGNARNMNITDSISYAFVCDTPHIAMKNCLRIRISADEYSIDPSTLTLLFQNETYGFTSYEIVDEADGEAEICVPKGYTGGLMVEASRNSSDDTGCASGYEIWLKTEGYLSAVLGRVSVIALASVIFTYCLFPQLRNLPGVNTMNLTMALFLAELIFITGENTRVAWLCTTVAVALHYFFLASHCWMNVMSYDVYRTFATNKCILTRVRDKRKYLSRYALYAWGVPLLVIGACLFIDFSNVFPALTIGYGDHWTGGNVSRFVSVTMEGKHEESVDYSSNSYQEERKNITLETVDIQYVFSCWIQNPVAALVAFGAPIMLIFLVNCVLFTRTIVAIQRTTRLLKLNRDKSQSSVHQMTGRNDVILYVKMSSVMGFTWVFGLASSVISAVVKETSDTVCVVVHVLGILFPILNSLQGVFIFCAFVLNRRVLKLFRNKFVYVRQTIIRRKSKLTSPFSTVAVVFQTDTGSTPESAR